MQIDANTQLTFTLTLDRTNLILGALGNSALPFNQVNQAITDIQQQATSQLQAMEAKAKAEQEAAAKALAEADAALPTEAQEAIPA